jgi:phosphotriesterase-related protein
MLESVGVPPERVILSHTDKVVDVDYHTSILGRGANVEYDQSLRRHLIGSDETVSLVARMWDEGFGSQIMLGTDGARRSLWTSLGGSPGLAWLYGSMPALLGTAGLSGAEIESMFVDNPARVLLLDR